MEATTSNWQQTLGEAPRGPEPVCGPQQAQGSPQHSQGRSEERHQPQRPPRPFFYVQPQHRFRTSLQWPMHLPMPLAYNPYSYSMPMMPHYQPRPPMEEPKFIVAFAPIPGMDYSEISKESYKTKAVYTSKYRLQQNTPARQMTDSEVQTDMVLLPPASNPPFSHVTESTNDLPFCNGNKQVKAHYGSTDLKCVNGNKVMGNRPVENQDLKPSSTTRELPKRSFDFKTEEIDTPTAVDCLHSHEAAELAHHTGQTPIKCHAGHNHSALMGGRMHLATLQTDQYQTACTDMVGTPPHSIIDKICAPHKSKTQAEIIGVGSDDGSAGEFSSDAQLMPSKKDTDADSKNIKTKILHLPFDTNYLEELRKIESTVWSMKDTCVPPECLMKNAQIGPHMEMGLAVEKWAHMEVLSNKKPTLGADPVVTLESKVEQAVADLRPVEEVSVIDANDACIVEMTATSKSPLVDIPISVIDVNPQMDKLNCQDHGDTSFESLPAYLPSSRRLSDYGSMYHRRQSPQTLQKQHKVLGSQASEVVMRKRKLSLEYKDHHITPKSRMERLKNVENLDWRSLSDHECYTTRNENAFDHWGLKGRQICASCLEKHRNHVSAGPGVRVQNIKRKGFSCKSRDEALLQTCETCKSHSKRQVVAKGLSPNTTRPYHSYETEGETSENSSSCFAPKRKDPVDQRRGSDPKRPLISKQHSEKCPLPPLPNLRERNCTCDAHHHPVLWEGPQLHTRGTVLGKRDENLIIPFPLQDKWNNVAQRSLVHRRQSEKPSKGEIRASIEGTKNGDGTRLNAPTKSQSQGIHRKDTRF